MIKILTLLNLNNHNKKYGRITQCSDSYWEKIGRNALKLSHTQYIHSWSLLYT